MKRHVCFRRLQMRLAQRIRHAKNASNAREYVELSKRKSFDVQLELWYRFDVSFTKAVSASANMFADVVCQARSRSLQPVEANTTLRLSIHASHTRT